MFVHNINPILLKIGCLEVRYYGLVYLFGFVLIYYILNKRRDGLGLKKEEVESFLFYIILGVIIGARIFEIIVWNPSYYFSNPLQMFALWKGGMSLHGGIIGIVIAVYIFCKRYRLNFFKIADMIVIPAAFVLALGRIANFINGELVGTITSVSWCFKFPGYSGCRHPVQLYGACGRFLLFGYLLALKNIKKWKKGFLFWNFILFMGIGRFFCDFLREDSRMFGLSIGQYLSLIMVIIAGYVLGKYHSKNLNMSKEVD